MEIKNEDYSQPSNEEIMEEFQKQFEEASKDDHDIEFAQEVVVEKFEIMHPHMMEEIKDYLRLKNIC